MTDNLPDRDTLARVIADPKGARLEPPTSLDYARADAVLDHLRTASPPSTPATDGLRERIEVLIENAAEIGRGVYAVDPTDLRDALAATGQPETADRPEQATGLVATEPLTEADVRRLLAVPPTDQPGEQP